ncbi:MAG: PKD-like domain-containing protein, partial [Bacteroidota bacterium]
MFIRFKRVSFFYLLLLLPFGVFSQVNITNGNASSNACIGGNPVSISNIVIQETGVNTDIGGAAFAGNLTIDLTLDNLADFNFVAGSGSVIAFPGSDDISGALITVTNTTVSIQLTLDNNNGTDFQDAVVISGLQVVALGGTPGVVEIEVGSIGGGTVSGLGVGDVLGSVTSVAAPTVDAGPDGSICEGSTYVLNGSSATNALSVFWSENGTGSLDNPNILNPTYTPGVGETGNVTFVLTVNGNGNCTSVQDTRVLTISSIPTLTVTNNDAIICSGSQTDIDLTTVPGASVIEITNITLSGAITGYSPIGYSFTNGSVLQDVLVNTTGSTQTIEYEFQSTLNGCSSTLQTTTVTVQPSLGAATITPSGPVVKCQGLGSILLSSSAAPPGGSYDWYKDGVSLGFFSQDYTVADAPASNGSYQVRWVDAEGCVGPLSLGINVQIDPLPLDRTVTAQTPVTICADGTVTLRVGTSQAGVSYVIIDQANNEVSGSFSGNGANLDITSSALLGTVSSLRVKAVNSTTGCQRILSPVIGVTVNPKPVGVSSVEGAVCSNATLNFDPQDNVDAGNGLPSTFTWGRSLEPGLTLAFDGGGSGVIDDEIENLSGGTLDVVYTVTPTSGGCVGSTFIIEVPIDPTPAVTSAASDNICSGSAVNYVPTGNVSGTIFNWTASNTV